MVGKRYQQQLGWGRENGQRQDLIWLVSDSGSFFNGQLNEPLSQYLEVDTNRRARGCCKEFCRLRMTAQ